MTNLHFVLIKNINIVIITVKLNFPSIFFANSSAFCFSADSDV